MMMRAASKAAAGAKALFLALVLLFAGALATSAPVSAFANAEEQPGVSVTGSDLIELGRIDIVALPVQTDPESIVVGVPCGMLEMCGQDPCLCGAVDEWGACACNGRENARPTFTLECERGGVAGVFELFGTSYLVALGAGSTDAVIHADLPHHESGELRTRIDVAPFGFIDALKIVVALIAAAAVCAVLFLLVRTIVRVSKRTVARIRARRAKPIGEALSAEKHGSVAETVPLDRQCVRAEADEDASDERRDCE